MGSLQRLLIGENVQEKSPEEREIAIAELLANLKLSVSSSGTYDECARKYRYQYIDKLPRKSHDYQDVGNFVHEVLQSFHDGLRFSVVPLDQWAPLMTKCCVDNWPKWKDKLNMEAQEKSHGLLKEYFRYLKDTGLPNVIATEEKFTIELGSDLIVRGVIDRVDLKEDGTYVISDYKTGKSKYLDDFQLKVYGMALQQRVPEVTSFVGEYIVLSEGPKIKSYKLTTADIDEARNELLRIAHEIRTDKTWDPKPTRLCNWCDFQEVCPAAYGKSQLVKIGRQSSF